MHAVCVIKLPYFYSYVREKWGGGQKIREINMFDHFFSAAVELLLLHFTIFFITIFFEYQVSGIKEEKGEKFLVLFLFSVFKDILNV